jgi:hypothetical protein
LELHDCIPIQIGAGSLVSSALLPEDFDFSPFHLEETLFRGTAIQFAHKYEHKVATIERAFDEVFEPLKRIFTNLVQIYHGFLGKINMNMTLEHVESGKLKTQTFITSYMKYINETESLMEANIMSALNYLIGSLNVHNFEGSNWRLVNINYMEIKCVQYRPQRGGTYVGPLNCFRGKCVINIKTNDDDCFLLSIICALFRNQICLPDKSGETYDQLGYRDRQRLKRLWSNPSTYASLVKKVVTEKIIDFHGFFGKTGIDDIERFEIQNAKVGQMNISVSVYGHKDSNIFPMRIPAIIQSNHVDLLFTEKDDICHWVVIPSLGKMFGGKNGKPKNEVCRKCFVSVHPDKLSQHETVCQARSEYRHISLPKDQFYEFKNLHMLEDVNFKIYYEIFGEPNNSAIIQTSSINSQTTPLSYSIVVVNPNNKVAQRRFYDGINVIQNLTKHLLLLHKKYSKIVATTCVAIKMSEDEKIKWSESTHCLFCKCEFSTEESTRKKCRHHHHFIQDKKVILKTCLFANNYFL